jgi:hypothetical protein
MQRFDAPLIACAMVGMSADAGIIYSGPISQRVDTNESVQFDIAGETFEIGVEANGVSGPNVFTWTYVIPVSTGAHLQTYRPENLWLIQSVPNYYPDVPVRLLEDEMVSDGSDGSSWLSTSNLQTHNGNPLVAFAQDKHGHPFVEDGYHGEWNADGGYVGFALGTGIDRRFGWMHFADMTGETLTLTGWAYTDVAGGSIGAGETSASTVVPGLGGLAALAIGATGVRSRRQRTVA